MSGKSEKKIIIIASLNRAGKTTFAGEFLTQEAHCPGSAAGLRNFEYLYKPAVDEWALYDNSGEKPIGNPD